MLQVVAIDMINTPNFFKQAVEWQVTSGNTASLWFQLQTVDSIGTRRYIPSAGALVKVEFMRARSTAVGQAAQTFQKTAAQDANDKSMFRIDLSAADTQNLISGTVKFLITEGANTTTVQQPYFIKKTLTGPGC